jgi:hypothetical protein
VKNESMLNIQKVGVKCRDFICWDFSFFRAADWKLDEPDWKGRLRIASKGTDLYIKLEDKNTGKSLLRSV